MTILIVFSDVQRSVYILPTIGDMLSFARLNREKMPLCANNSKRLLEPQI